MILLKIDFFTTNCTMSSILETQTLKIKSSENEEFKFNVFQKQASQGIIQKSELFTDQKLKLVNAEIAYNIFGYPICYCQKGLPLHKKWLKHHLLSNIYVEVYLCKSCYDVFSEW